MANLDLIRGRQVVIPLVNRTGGDVVNGDVVVLDTTADGSFVATTTERVVIMVGIVQETIVSMGTGRVLISGYAPLVNVTAAVTRGHFAETSTTLKAANGNASRRSGAFGEFLKSGTAPDAVVWGMPDGTSGAVGAGATDGRMFFSMVPGEEGEKGDPGPPGPVGPLGEGVVGIEFIIDGGGIAITTGNKGYIEVPFNCTITAVRLFADQTGSIVVDIWKDTYVNFPPLVADTITAAAKPTISAAQKYSDATLTGWTTSIAAGDVLAYNVDSVATLQRCTVVLTVRRLM